MDEETAREALGDAVALWAARATFGPDEVIAAATDALVAGVDSPTLRELAGASNGNDYWTLRPLIEGALEELGIPLPAPGADETQVAATRVMAKRVINGSLTPADFTGWAHATIGHEGALQLQPLVDLDDARDVTDYTGDNLSDLDGVARSMALSLLAGESLRQPSNVGLHRGTEPVSETDRSIHRPVDTGSPGHLGVGLGAVALAGLFVAGLVLASSWFVALSEGVLAAAWLIAFTATFAVLVCAFREARATN